MIRNLALAVAAFLAIVGAQLAFGFESLTALAGSTASQPVPVANVHPEPFRFDGPMIRVDLSSAPKDPRVESLKHCLVNATADYPGNGSVAGDHADVPAEMADGCADAAGLDLRPVGPPASPTKDI